MREKWQKCVNLPAFAPKNLRYVLHMLKEFGPKSMVCNTKPLLK